MKHSNIDINNELEMQAREEGGDYMYEINDGQLKLFIGGLNYLSLKSIFFIMMKVT